MDTPPPTPEQRIAALEAEMLLLRQSSRPHLVERLVATPQVPPVGTVENLFLTFGQIVSALGCAIAPFWAMFTLAVMSTIAVQTRDPAPTLHPAWVVISAALSFLSSAAMFVVFTRCKRVT